jgi:hypothetical protein
MLEWESLAEALQRVVSVGVEIETAKKEICDHIAQDLIRFRVLPSGSSQFLTGKMAVQVPPLLKPMDLDWEQSRPKRQWQVDPWKFYSWEKSEINLIQLCIFDVESQLCDPKRTSESPSKPTKGISENRTDDSSAGRPSRKRGKPAVGPNEHRRDIEAVISFAKREYPPPKKKSVSFAEMAKRLKSLDETRRYGWSAISQILRGTYPKMRELNIKSPYVSK